nr:putative ribonuclease H-like domain-containing protein [Tanacetum cinerariifolium]
MTKLDNELANQAKWNNSGTNLYKLIDSSMSVRTKHGLGLDKYIGEGELGIDDSVVSIFHTNSDDLEGQPIYNSVFAPASESSDTIVIDCTRQEDFPNVCTSSIETNVKSSKPLCNPFGSFNKGIHFRKHKSCYVCGSYLHLIKDCDLHEQRLVKRHAERKGILGRRPTGKPVNLNRPKIVSAGQPNSVSAGQPNSIFDGLPNLVYAGQPNPVFAGDGLLGPQPLNHQPPRSFSQTYRVLFTENECLVLSKYFPLPDPSMVILSIPRKHNLYTFSLNELAPQGPLTCLIAKASQTESTLWHWRLGHVNFKNMNKLVKGNLVRVATACYVLNRVLVTKPYAKTPYELLTRDKPSISYLKPFGCHVTILNTSESLEKFDKKSDEGYIIGYSISSKAYRVYNLVSRKIEETMNLIFLENKPFVAGTGQAWMFDIDYLTNSLNYSRVSRTNLTAVVPIVDEATIQHDGAKSDHATTNAANLDEFTELQSLQMQEQAGKEEADRLGLVFPSLNPILAVGSASIGSSVSAGSTPPISAASHVPAVRPPVSVGRSTSAGRPIDSVGRPVSTGRPSGSAARTPVPAGSILGTVTESASSDRFSRGSSVENFDIHDGLTIFDCLKSGIFTSSSYDKDFFGPDANNLESSFDVSSIITKRIHSIHLTSQALEDPDWVEAMQAEMQQFRNQKSAFLYGKIAKEVYVTQPRGFEDPDHLKKVYKVVKALYGVHQAPRAWYERLSTFLLKHGYRRRTINRTLFIKKNSKSEFEMSSMGPVTFFLGLQVYQRPDGIFIHQAKYVANILKKFDLENFKLASTPFEPQKIREKNVPDSPISVHLYRSMIGCLMYLTATRPNIMFVVCVTAKHQVTPKTSRLLSVKRIFKYLTAYPKLGLWYPCDSQFDLEAFSDSDYAGAHGDKKSTTGGCQFLGRRLISWQCKKQTIITTSSCEAKYVAAASCCGQKWLLVTSAGRVIFCWLIVIPAGDLVPAGG